MKSFSKFRYEIEFLQQRNAGNRFEGATVDSGMLPIKIYTPGKIFRHYTGMSFFIFILISRPKKDDESLTRHEMIHFWQQVEMLFVFHWILYLYYYFQSRLLGNSHHVAYRNNPFEREAYAHEADVRYLKTRKPLNWRKFVH
ncbi:MAG TPA: hypothetical protein VD816_03475 [Ohtaekwangia sp.]|nr:hypothetical protein [Ohtaekwangia sp.]